MWTINASNGGSGTAYATQINGFTLTQVAGTPCKPALKPPSHLPLTLGDIASRQSVKSALVIDFTGCSSLARFTLNMPWSSARYDTGTFAPANQPQ